MVLHFTCCTFFIFIVLSKTRVQTWFGGLTVLQAIICVNNKQKNQLQASEFQHLRSLFWLLMTISLKSSYVQSPPHLLQEPSGECWSVFQSLWLPMGKVACFSIVLFPRNAVLWAYSVYNLILLGGICLACHPTVRSEINNFSGFFLCNIFLVLKMCLTGSV